MKLKIQLLSDLCTGVGEGYNTSVDQDIAYDEYGFPCIPAKRIKGCIREACLELEEARAVPFGSTDRIFGTEGAAPSRFTLSDAYLEGYEDLVSDLLQWNDPYLTHPQNVLGLYTYIRAQTAMDTDSGAAKTGSLRTTRVVKKGLTFFSDLQMREDLKEADIQILKDAASMVVHMGLHRTRGLGTVHVECLDSNDTEKAAFVSEDVIGEKNKLHYSIQLLSPVLCKSAQGNQTITQDYLEGAKLLGLLAGELGTEKYQELADGLIISHAYIMRGTNRCIPMAVSLQKKKDQRFQDGTMEVCDMLLQDAHEQMTAISIPYVDKNGYAMRVDTEINYHHKRPKDKGCGRADGTEDSSFYQMQSIRRGQKFGGFIYANRDQAKSICEALRGMKHVRMGYGKNTQYGEVKIRIDRIETLAEQKEKAVLHDFRVKLNAPVLLYNKYGMYSADVEDLKQALSDLFGMADLRIDKMFMSYETVGGFNTTWLRRKPIFTALGRGSVCMFHSDTGISVNRDEPVFLGERISEGYGEVEITEIPDAKQVLRRDNVDWRISDKAEGTSQKTNLSVLLMKEQFRKEIEAEARRDADRRVSSLAGQREASSVVARLLMIFRENESFDQMELQVNGIESDSKREIANLLLTDIKQALTRSYLYETGQETENERYRLYSVAYLKQLKYRLRAEKSERRNSHE